MEYSNYFLQFQGNDTGINRTLLHGYWASSITEIRATHRNISIFLSQESLGIISHKFFFMHPYAFMLSFIIWLFACTIIR